MTVNPSSSRNAPDENRGRFCLNCQKDISHKKTGAQYCSPECQQADRTKSRPFIGLDGEGIGNRYVLLAAKRKGWKVKAIQSREGLSTIQCLDFLLSLPKGSHSGVRPIYIWFAFDYDVNMILGDLPLKGEHESIEELRRTNTTYFAGFKITYIPRKILKVSKDGRHFHSTDGWGFFQATFEKALSDWGIEVPEIITRGKAARQDFSSWDDADILAYNNAELDMLSDLMEALRDSVNPLGLRVQSWHGPGALAGSWLSKNGAKKRLADIPDELYEIATRAYFGGRIEASGYGFVEPVYHYDVVSAYPSAIRYLPDLTTLKWHYSKGRPPRAGVSVQRIRWRIPETKWGPFPWRSRNGTIRFPCEGEGWYWQREVEAALTRFPEDSFQWVESWYVDHAVSLPFKNVVEEAFEYRHELKRQGHPSHIAVKLILNSLYGKLAQTIGKAQYYSPVWAGLITSYTRAELSFALNDSVVCCMTDSLWSKLPLSLDTGGKLGEWESQDETRLILGMAGLYEAHSPSGERFIWQRGFDKRTPVDIPGIVSAWLYDDPTFEGVYSVNRFIGMGLASVTSYPWRHWIDLERRIQPVPLVGTTKREPLFPLTGNERKTDGFQELEIRPRDEERISYPYSKLTLDPEMRVLTLSDEATDL